VRLQSPAARSHGVAVANHQQSGPIMADGLEWEPKCGFWGAIGCGIEVELSEISSLVQHEGRFHARQANHRGTALPNAVSRTKSRPTRKISGVFGRSKRENGPLWSI